MSIKVGMVSLGCAKNQVDGELMLAKLANDGFEIKSNPAECDAVIINTCGFIEDAKKESIETIFEFCGMKTNSNLKAVIVTGCLAERYREELVKEIPEVDVVLGIGKNSDISNAIKKAVNGEKIAEFGPKSDLSLEGERILANPPHFAYIKVAEGCDNKCSYCAIPLIRGEFRSRPMENIIKEIESLAEKGVKEFNIVAQDTTRYGEDLYGKFMLAELIKKVCAIEKVEWVRILYCYPDRITDELLETIASEDKVVKYVDIPIQHASGKILKLMNRKGDFNSIKSLMEKIRAKIPNVALRTTLIAGFPGETNEDFAELCELVEEVKFDRLGCFSYSPEEDTPAFEMEDQIDDQLKARRTDIIMELQMEVAEDLAQSMNGKTLKILTEGFDYDAGMYWGRSYMDAPDIDTKVYFMSNSKPNAGDFVNVLITDVDEYDLIGEEM
ncbi:MAG: 30S ribosomal protein S12 methylthiotransferase RimO [Oscillospiraceae bacterium]